MNLSISTLFINLDKCDIKFLVLNLKFCYFFLFLHCLYLLKKAKEKKEIKVGNPKKLLRLGVKTCDLTVALSIFNGTHTLLP